MGNRVRNKEEEKDGERCVHTNLCKECKYTNTTTII